MSLILAFLAVGCASTRPKHVWTDEALAAETMQIEENWDEARTAYEALLPDAPTTDKRRWLQLRAAMLEVESGNVALGREKLAEIYEDDVFDEHGANAMYEAAQLLDADDPGAARAMRLRAIRRYPDQIAAEFALRDIVDADVSLDQSAASRALADLLRELHPEVADSELGDNVLFQLARVQDLQLGEHDAALETYRSIYRDYRKGPLADDALWELARLYRRHEQWEPAISALTILANDQESSWFIGSYDSAWVDDAIYDLGLIHLLYLDDYDVAVQWFERYLKEFGTGMLADDAAWHIVQARRLAGDPVAYRESLEEFVARFPESRFVDEAQTLMDGSRVGVSR